MVKVINKSVCRGVAGRRNGAVKGVVIHNDAGSMSAEQYVNWLANKTAKGLEAGFAHYYIDRNTIARTEDTYNGAWHTANRDGNMYYIGYEVCQSLSASDKDFLANEQMVFKQAAEDLKYYKLPVNRNTVRLHREFVSTSCPHRSWELHGKSVNAVKDYFISQIKKYYDGKTTTTPSTPSKPVTPTPSKPATNTGWIAENGTFTANTTINVRSSDSDKSSVVAQYKAGQSVRYNAYRIDKNGYVWLRYTAGSGNQRYIASGESKNGKRVNYWGTFK